MSYRAPTKEFSFLLNDILSLGDLSTTARFADATPDVVDAVLTEAARMCDDILAPLQRQGDLHPAHLENGVVRTPPGFADGYRAIADGGWTGITASTAHGGMALPQTVATAVNDMMSGACLALQLNPLMSQGQIEAIEAHASPELQAIYLPKLISGEWSGTMNLTEPQAGSDVGALRSRAEPAGDGSYRVTGQKIFISWADNDFTENVVHLVLARLPDAPPGSKGISLFLVPKRIPREDGAPGTANSLGPVSLEHKLGLHGSPTAVMQFDAATGWMVGQPNNGLAAMFTMMNNARLGVGVQGIGTAEGAYQHALAYARERRQGKAPDTGSIIDHADVRRMLTTMKADLFAARAIALACAFAIDMEAATGDTAWRDRAGLLTPIAKAFGTDIGAEVCHMGVQVHGGMGFIEETGAAQYSRDVRVTSIYEGTNGIQSMDLVGRKLADGGAALFDLIDELQARAEAARAASDDLAGRVWDAAESLREAGEWMVEQGLQDRFAGAAPFLRACGRVLGAHFHLAAAVVAGSGTPRWAMAEFYIRRLLPEHIGLLAHAREGADGLYALSPDDFAA